MKIAIIQFPGSNCERESALAIQRAGMEPEEFLWNELQAKLSEYDGYFIVGGFSYEDRSRAGIIAALDPVMQIIRQESEKGKPVLGICNGAQVLVETGLVPGLKDYRIGMALGANRRMQGKRVMGTGFYNSWTYIQLIIPSRRCAFSHHLKKNEIIKIPVAHAEGRFIVPGQLLELMQKEAMLAFRYVDEEGEFISDFPINPNGSTANLAAVINPAGNVMAIMPHPERTPNGDPLFTSMRDYILETQKIHLRQLDYTPESPEIKSYRKPDHATELLIDLIITDNEAMTVENALQLMNISVQVRRQTHWEIQYQLFDPSRVNQILDEITKSGELFNSNKEIISAQPAAPRSIRILTRLRDDITGTHKLGVLERWFHIKGIQKICKGTLWIISTPEQHIQASLQKILDSHILFNPYSYEVFWYDSGIQIPD
jgi:phosphoribosylformylglycinamidine synthase